MEMVTWGVTLCPIIEVRRGAQKTAAAALIRNVDTYTQLLGSRCRKLAIFMTFVITTTE